MKAKNWKAEAQEFVLSRNTVYMDSLPSASDVRITVEIPVGENGEETSFVPLGTKVTCEYTYHDVDNDVEDRSGLLTENTVGTYGPKSALRVAV